MSCTRRTFLSWAAATSALGLASCTQPHEEPAPADEEPSVEPEEPKVDLKEFAALELDPTAWEYDEDNDAYYQLEIPYCTAPASATYESLAIFVPGAYFSFDEEKKKPTVVINEDAKVGSFTAKTAPVVMPINSGALGPQASPTSFSYAGLDSYLSAGCVYVYAGFRGRSSGYESEAKGEYPGGDPWPVVDLKAAVRFLRYNAEALPCDTERVFVFGFSAGGGVGAVLGASGDSELYEPYLAQIGAATHDAEGEPLSDAVFGAASWCPITSFDTADAAYEWMMGQYFEEGSRAEGTWTKLFSDDLAEAYAGYINDAGFCAKDGTRLGLDETPGERFAAGSYYTHLLSCIEKAAAKFLTNTQFPYTYTPHHLVNANFPGDPNLQSVAAGAPDIDAVTGDASAQAAGVAQDSLGGEGTKVVESVVYNTPADYINALNADGWWITYNQTKNTVELTTLADFVRRYKVAVKEVGAFDALDRSSVLNQLFGVDEVGSLHFSSMMYDQLVRGRDTYKEGDGWQEEVVEDWETDLAQIDSLQTDMATRMDMFNPLYFLCDYYDGYGSSQVAPHWRINSGLFQTDTSLCTEVNLALALGQAEGVKTVEFNPVWGQGHVLAEVVGTAEANLLSWVIASCEA